MSAALDRRLGLLGSTAVGISAMVGAGLFVVFGPATAAAGSGLFLALGIAALIAACNAVSSARLARLHPDSGGTYVYGRERLGPFWGHLAGWCFVVGKLASCAAMALAVGTYAWPDHRQAIAIAAIIAVTGINLGGVEKSAAAGIIIVVTVLTVVAISVVAMAFGPAAPAINLPTSGRGVLGAAGLLFFAFAGYARLATLGEEVRTPERTIPRAIGIAVVLVVIVYAGSAIALLHVLGPQMLADSDRAFVAGVDAAGAHGLTPIVVAAAALAAGGALLSLTLGVSRTMLAMARDRHLPRQLAFVGARHRVPHIAEITVALIACALVVLGDVTTSIAFSSFCVLVYYAIANAAAMTISRSVPGRSVAVLGLLGCLLLAVFLPWSSVAAGSAVVAIGAASFVVRRPSRRRDAST